MPRLDLWTAFRASIVLLLTLSLMSGFADSDGLTLGTTVDGSPTPDTSGAPVSGTQVSGEIIGLDTFQAPPLLLIQTSSGPIYVQLANPAWVGGLGPGVLVTFSGDFLAPDRFNATTMVDNALGSTTAAGDLSLGAPLGSTTVTGSSSNTSSGSSSSSDSTTSNDNATNDNATNDNSTNDNSSNSNSENDNSDCSDNSNSFNSNSFNANSSDCFDFDPTPIPTQTACSSSQNLAVTTESGTNPVSTSYPVQVAVSLSGNCSGKTIYLKVLQGPNEGLKLSSVLSSNNIAIFTNYTGGANTGTDFFQVWLDYVPNGTFEDSEPTRAGSVTWTSASASRLSRTTSVGAATPTATGTPAVASPAKTSTSAPTVTPTKTATATPTPNGKTAKQR